MEGLSGPIEYVSLIWRNRTYILLSDRHNSSEGQCQGMCSDLREPNKPIQGKAHCETLTHYLDKQLQEGCSIFLEASYVLRDEKRSEHATNPDMIDQLLWVFHEVLLRKKKNIYPKSTFHYVDIRDTFYGDYNEKGCRAMMASTPFSSSMIVRSLREGVTPGKLRETTYLLKHIISNAEQYYRDYVSGTPSFSPCEVLGPVTSEFNERLDRCRLLTSVYNKVRISRVRKQLEKLVPELRNLILHWASERFKHELSISRDIVKNIELALVQGSPVEVLYDSILLSAVTLSSVIMDVYTLSRSFYHQQGNKTIFYCGGAHIRNYLSFFSFVGAVVESRGSAVSERCLLI